MADGIDYEVDYSVPAEAAPQPPTSHASMTLRDGIIVIEKGGVVLAAGRPEDLYSLASYILRACLMSEAAHGTLENFLEEGEIPTAEGLVERLLDGLHDEILTKIGPNLSRVLTERRPPQ